MDCNYLKECGSCTLFTPYDEQILFKTDLVKQNFSEFYDGEFDVFGSNPKHYRTRAEFGIWHDGSELSYTMHASEKGKRIFIDECPKVCEQISSLMPSLLKSLQESEMLRTKLFGVEFISCKSGTLVTLLYHKKLDSEFEVEIKNLANKLNITILARSRGQKLLSGELNLIDELDVGGQIYKFSLSENAFIQPNKAVNEKMIAWAKECVQGGADLLELYCGHGNFTIPLSFKFKNVLATEISKSSIANALKNCELNRAENIKFLRMDADELMSAFAGVREFNRLKDINLSDFNFSHVLVDPPRAGLSESVINFIRNFKNIIYISCNPETLKENLNELTKSHKVIKFALFDQFANTHHIECGVLLEAKDKF
ncbi:tRNA (uridine(54)-C5)-methyltransferase TrmA [Campylobacter concisus]|uniref:tRNA (uridine(54)-C5)-methyltransferase TrmA n=1 Tax=Campylobacter concisus TaxID=199 RepID=UPI000CD95BF0|nr:tRNA (uridine(54)-C5)-methyltransferase TrmA [Campylobacter concisus]